jgi:hypothetical protein
MTTYRVSPKKWTLSSSNQPWPIVVVRWCDTNDNLVPRLFPLVEERSTPAFLDMNIEYWNYYRNLAYIWPIFVCAFCSFCCKGILELTLYFIYFAPSAHLIQSWNLFQTSNFNNAHFRIQYRTRFIQYCTKCAILHTKIGPVYFNHASEVQL